MNDDDPQTVSRIKTGAVERRFSMARTGTVVGARMAGHSILNLFYGSDARKARQSKLLSKQAQYLADELGKLKGSVVKVGQMMALYGEHFLPEEVTEALHTLEDQTISLEWDAIEEVLVERLGSKLDELDVEQSPLGAASLGQVHRAKRKSDGREICLKIQYPGVADAIDSDINAVAQLMRLAKMVPKGIDFEAWLDEVRTMLRKEVDYDHELKTTAEFGARLKDDSRFIVPEVFPEYSSDTILATSYEPGKQVNSESVLMLSQLRRNALANAALDLFCHEFFRWKVLQTDPNFGNYRVRIDRNGQADRLVLLDFGAVREFPDAFLEPFYEVVRGAFDHDRDRLIAGATAMGLMRENMPEKVLNDFTTMAFRAIEPFADWSVNPAPEEFLNENGEYCWGRSDLPTRVALFGANAALTRHFHMPPKEFVFMIRKLVGVYTFISVLDGQLIARETLGNYLQS